MACALGFGFVPAFAVRAFAATGPAAKDTVQGKLVERKDKAPLLRTGDGREIELSGDDETLKVLNDPRLDGVTLEAIGHFTSAAQFAIGPLYDTNMFVLKNGKRLHITYWCNVCSIRTYVPGNCVCCQKWTDLDLQDPNQK